MKKKKYQNKIVVRVADIFAQFNWRSREKVLVAGFVVFALSFEVFKLYRQLQELAGDGVKMENGIKKWREKKKW